MIFILFSFFAYVAFTIGQFADKNQLRKSLAEHLSLPRHTETEKLPTVAWIDQTFHKYKLLVIHQSLFSYTKQKGQNIIGILPGVLHGTPADVIALIGAHYDTVEGSPGVNDNGSGISVMLETARILSTWAQICKPQFSTIFVAFDFEEIGFFGSSIFVHEWLIPFLYETPKSRFSGAFILDTVLNYDDRPGSQLVSDVILKHFPEFISVLGYHKYSGTFIQAVQRDPIDSGLFEIFNRAYLISKTIERNISTWILPLTVPISRLLTPEDMWNYMTFVRSDHRSFWFNQANYTLPSIYLSDSVQHRGVMQKCYHSACDNKKLITEENLSFLATIVDSLVRAVDGLTRSKCSSLLFKCPASFFQPNYILSIKLALAFRYDCSYPVDLNDLLGR